MKKVTILIPIFVIIFTTGCDKHKSAIKSALNNYTNAIEKGDYARMVSFMPPEIVNSAGGTEVMTQTVASSMSNLKIDKVKVEHIQAVEDEDGDIVSVIDNETYATVKSNGKRMKIEGNIYGISTDKGKTWYFLDGNAQSKQILVTVSPSAVQKLEFKEQKIFIDNNGKWVTTAH